MLGFCPLASGSKGNSIFVGTKNTRILIDAGLSASLLEKRLASIGVPLNTIDAVLVTHDHIDHIQGLGMLHKKWNIPIFANADTARAICAHFQMRPRFKIFTTGEMFQFADLIAHPFTIPHDTLDPVGFTLQIGSVKVGFCTDLGCVTSLIQKALEGVNYLYLEANHEPSMVYSSHRPQVYKQRVLSRQGHLSNREAAELICSLHHAELQHVHLAHLSSECNSEEMALKVVGDVLETQNIELPLSIARQHEVSKSVLFTHF